MKILKEVNNNGARIIIAEGDITESDTDAIVNPANSYLQHGGGVAGAIVRKGGHIIQVESDKIGFVEVGNCAITGGGHLRAPYVIHTVGPRMGEGDEDAKLHKAIQSTFALAAAKGLKSIAIPAISAGIFGFPKDKCARIIVEETLTFTGRNRTSLEEIIFCLIDKDIIGFFSAELDSQELHRRMVTGKA